jgi:hypothetical protein
MSHHSYGPIRLKNSDRHFWIHSVFVLKSTAHSKRDLRSLIKSLLAAATPSSLGRAGTVWGAQSQIDILQQGVLTLKDYNNILLDFLRVEFGSIKLNQISILAKTTTT